MAENDKQADALIAALAPKIAEAILPQIAASVENQIKGLKDKNDELLDKLAKQKQTDDHNDLMESTKRLLDAADAQQQQRFDKYGNSRPPSRDDSIKISRTDARDVAKYRDARALAEKEGRKLEIVSDA